MTDNHPKHLSTTALAKKIGKESKELFILLANSGWIVKVESHWQLTAKGRFEGGTYANHPRFGEYIVWPASISEHPVLGLLPEAPLSARTLAQKTGLPARLINRVLANIGWLKPYIHGWLVTDLGKEKGGQQHEGEANAIPFVTWPEVMLEDASFQRAVSGLTLGATQCLDGHSAEAPALTCIDNWLYTLGIAHAVEYTLYINSDSSSSCVVDFYLPSANAVILYWPDAPSPDVLATKLAQRESLLHSRIAIIELTLSQLDNIDELLTRELLKLGVAVY
ncbi:4-alpha-glucanotransferase [Gilvimarinus agarilyticus]|uniref:4-alpha-glucanotransferase n=1 Tax=Gilvimarinus sp. 2_MG-2023 TaxID=3062666 RepID=UPI001C093BA3|nr:4-alpha-glucanotransferase [Gilvimarinus sp. 2_MG-2023]MBU2886988.1 4-alpha-glucanotransferase [Gilvimarinus agarilyticus]MDO6571648.1 4-alpha-glucanotransferase [Gilvimarinus sp. 2_MG-2023]